MRKLTKTNLIWNQKQTATTPMWRWALTKTNQPARPTATSYRQWYTGSSPLRPEPGRMTTVQAVPALLANAPRQERDRDMKNGTERQKCHCLQSACRKWQRIDRHSSTRIQQGQPKARWLGGKEVSPALRERWETWVHSLGWEDSLQKETALHSNMLARKMLWMWKAGGLKSKRAHTSTTRKAEVTNGHQCKSTDQPGERLTKGVHRLCERSKAARLKGTGDRAAWSLLRFRPPPLTHPGLPWVLPSC